MRPLNTPKHCSNWLKQSNNMLTAYQQKTQQLIHLNKLWRSHIDPILAANSYIANFHEKVLVLEVENASWGNRLHYCIPDLLLQIKTWKMLHAVESITWYIKPQSYIPSLQQGIRKQTILSQDTQDLLQTIANTIVHPELQMALRQLARNSNIKIAKR